MEVYFNMQQLPRTLSKDEWKIAWRDVRKMRKETAKMNEQKRQVLLLCKNENIRAKMLDELIYPPLLLGPYMEMKSGNF